MIDFLRYLLQESPIDLAFFVTSLSGCLWLRAWENREERRARVLDEFLKPKKKSK